MNDRIEVVLEPMQRECALKPIVAGRAGLGSRFGDFIRLG